MAEAKKSTGRALSWLIATEQRTKTNVLKPDHVRPRLVCNDGFSMSLQSGPKHFCSLRNPTDGPMPVPSPYTDAEIWKTRSGDTEFLDPIIAEYGDGDDPYGWVPLELVDTLISAHGGVLGDPKKRQALAPRTARTLAFSGADEINITTVVKRPRHVRIG